MTRETDGGAPLTLAQGAHITASAPVRVDMGGTLDMPAFYFPLTHLRPLTVNLAVSLRTQVELTAWKSGENRIVSRGFAPVTWPAGTLRNDHPLGFIAAILAAFQASGLQVTIDSAAPPRSGMGGSSTVAVALVAALYHLSGRQEMDDTLRRDIAAAAHGIESSVLGIPCGMQDHLAAAFGGMHAWYWQGIRPGGGYRRKPLIPAAEADRWSSRLRVAYLGEPHDSAAVNSVWVTQFLGGRFCAEWEAIIRCTHAFCAAVERGDVPRAAAAMNQETDIRCSLTPDVLTPLGRLLTDAGRKHGCGVRFTGAGAGGCLWALGAEGDICKMSSEWADIMNSSADAGQIDCHVDLSGVTVAA
ncbi:MAG: galactokinase [Deltaproteobacteria bacterium]|nr:MAG: galactokinase [Deltaproteobacteria bacterium]